MSHLTADAGLSHMSRAKRLMRHHVTPHRRRMYMFYMVKYPTSHRVLYYTIRCRIVSAS